MRLPRQARISAIASIAVAACFLASCEPAEEEGTAAATQSTATVVTPEDQSDRSPEPTAEPRGVNYDKNPCDLIDPIPLDLYGFDSTLEDISLRPDAEEVGSTALVCVNRDWSVTLDAHYIGSPAEAAAAVEGSKPLPGSYQMSQGTISSPIRTGAGYIWLNHNRGDGQASWAAGDYQHVLTIVWDTTNPNLPHTTDKADLLDMVEQISAATEGRQHDQGW